MELAKSSRNTSHQGYVSFSCSFCLPRKQRHSVWGTSSPQKAKVYMICRNNERAEQAKIEILQAHKDSGLDIPAENLRSFVRDLFGIGFHLKSVIVNHIWNYAQYLARKTSDYHFHRDRAADIRLLAGLRHASPGERHRAQVGARMRGYSSIVTYWGRSSRLCHCGVCADFARAKDGHLQFSNGQPITAENQMASTAWSATPARWTRSCDAPPRASRPPSPATCCAGATGSRRRFRCVAEGGVSRLSVMFGSSSVHGLSHYVRF